MLCEYIEPSFLVATEAMKNSLQIPFEQNTIWLISHGEMEMKKRIIAKKTSFFFCLKIFVFFSKKGAIIKTGNIRNIGFFSIIPNAQRKEEKYKYLFSSNFRKDI